MRIARDQLLARAEHRDLRIDQAVLRDKAGAILRLDRVRGRLRVGDRALQRRIAATLGIYPRERILDIAQRPKHGGAIAQVRLFPVLLAQADRRLAPPPIEQGEGYPPYPRRLDTVAGHERSKRGGDELRHPGQFEFRVEVGHRHADICGRCRQLALGRANVGAAAQQIRRQTGGNDRHRLQCRERPGQFSRQTFRLGPQQNAQRVNPHPHIRAQRLKPCLDAGNRLLLSFHVDLWTEPDLGDIARDLQRAPLLAEFVLDHGNLRLVQS
ncbi:hypothetical protein D9M73_113060 [compost metagenome]